MRGRRPAVAAGALLALALAAPSVASWVVGGSGAAAGTAGSLGAPTALATSAVTESALVLSWTAPSGLQPDGYVVRRNGEVVGACERVVATSCRESGLSPSTSYRYTVAAVLGGWQGDPSDAVVATTATPAPTDTTAPTLLSLRRAGTSATTSAGTVSWTATFSEAVTGVDDEDFELAGTLTGGSVTGVTGSGTTWTVTASTGTGSGTLGVDLVDDDTVVDAAALPLGGPGTGARVGGEAYTISRGAPGVTVEQKVGQADPVRAVPMLWTVRFSAPVTGFDASDLLRTGTTGGTVTVSGSGAEYEIQLGGAPTNGTTTFTVPVGRAVDAAGVGNTASTSVDNAITYDTTAPALAGRVVGSNGNKELFSGTTSESTGALELVVHNASGTEVLRRPLGLAVGTSGVTWSHETQPTELNNRTSYTWRVEHTDAAGNVGTVSGGPFPGN